MWITAAGSIVNHDSKPKTTKTPRATNMRPRSAAGLSDRSLSLIHSPLDSKNGAQGRIRTSVTRRVADLQSAAINHSATCALMLYRLPIPQPIASCRSLARSNTARNLSREIICQELSMANAARLEQLAGTTNLLLPSTTAPSTAAPEIWSWRRDLNPRPPDYKSGALPAELRQPISRAPFESLRLNFSARSSPGGTPKPLKTSLPN